MTQNDQLDTSRTEIETKVLAVLSADRSGCDTDKTVYIQNTTQAPNSKTEHLAKVGHRWIRFSSWISSRDDEIEITTPEIGSYLYVTAVNLSEDLMEQQIRLRALDIIEIKHSHCNTCFWAQVVRFASEIATALNKRWEWRAEEAVRESLHEERAGLSESLAWTSKSEELYSGSKHIGMSVINEILVAELSDQDRKELTDLLQFVLSEAVDEYRGETNPDAEYIARVKIK